MASFQSHITRFVIKKLVAPKLFDKTLPISKQREALERIQKLSMMPLGVKRDALKIVSLDAVWLTPKDCDDKRVILYLHGGGYNIGSIRSHQEMAARLAKQAGIKTLLVEYRKAPEHPYPAALEDAKLAYKWLLEQGYKSGDIAIAGDSAGGGLTLSTAIALRDEGISLPACLCVFSPWTDVAMTGETMNPSKNDPMLNVPWIKQMADGYSGGQNTSAPTMSPLYASLKDLPPMLIHVGTEELLLSDSTRFAEKADAAGVKVSLNIWPDMWHVWHTHAGFMPESKQALEEAGGYIREYLLRN